MDFLEVVMIDWYDGDVLSLALTQDPRSWYLASLLSCDQAKNLRIYVLLPIDGQVATDIRRLLDDSADSDSETKKAHWQSILRIIESTKKARKGRLDVLECSSLREPILSNWRIDSDSIELIGRIGQPFECALEAFDSGLRFGRGQSE